MLVRHHIVTSSLKAIVRIPQRKLCPIFAKGDPGRRNARNGRSSGFVRTNVLADFVSKFTNDINMISNSEEDVEQCKYIAYVNCIIIICILVYMFFDPPGNAGDSEP